MYLGAPCLHSPYVPLPLPATLEAPGELGLLMSRPSRDPVDCVSEVCVSMPVRVLAPSVLMWVSVHSTCVFVDVRVCTNW